MGFWVNNAREWQRNNKYNNKTMAIKATKKEGNKRELLAPDNYTARCCKIVELGTEEYEKNGETREIHKAVLFFEIVPMDTPVMVSKEISLNTNKDSELRKMLNTWRSVDLTDEQADEFDITVLLGVPALVTVGHKHISYSGGSFEVEEILSVNKVPSNITCAKGKLPTVVLSFDDWNDAVFNELPKHLQKKITNSREYKEKFGPLADTSDRPNGRTK